MTTVCSISPITHTVSAPTPGELAKAVAGRLATRVTRLARAMAENRRRRLDQAALEALPFDLRKDLGWPAHDMRRQA